MRSGVARLKAAALGCLLIWCPAAVADEGAAAGQVETSKTAVTAPADASAPAAVRMEETQPSLYYLKDKQGNLQAVPNFSFEDFEELYRLKHQLAQGEQRPRYSIQQVSAHGTATPAGAELTIEFRILVREEQWLRVPLHLDQAVLRQQPQYQGPGEQFLHFEGEGEGYVLWVHGPAGQQQQVTL